MRSTDPKELEESYQLLKSLIPMKPYPTVEPLNDRKGLDVWNDWNNWNVWNRRQIA